ncbi:uncharacterized protein EDB91DRAFT_1263533 [Suillus paluster]|uniref:uncharacterized protein n=1 Tax=Suillus paluster TaxID=48578 RepID=UPI001B85C468|nr:uncharacterized protein EDB91DRAFT_1263533 [Suillus paluster]KAG1726700.1 hypothetical protein EDB91DRAFT_1263533 [Suillus paluster]
MAASSESTEQYWKTGSISSLLAHGALPDSDSIISNAKSTAETVTDFYNRTLTTRRYALAGVACSSIISCFCIVAGILIISTHGISGIVQVLSFESDLQLRMLSLTLNLIVTLCTESIGFMHNISLRSALASDSRLTFNSNLRLMTAARGWCNPNGALFNGIMAVLLTISYSSAPLAVYYFWIAGFPLLILGLTLFLQVAITLAGMRAVKILTWSSSPFDVTAALIHHTQLTPASFRCMCGVSDIDTTGGPMKPLEAQPSAWHAHPSIRKVILFIWVLVVACAGWGALVVYKHNTTPTSPQSWSFIPSGDTPALTYDVSTSGGNTIWVWLLAVVNIAVFQAPLTLGLHCSELIVNVIQNERQWRCATSSNGLSTTTNPLKAFLTNPLGLVLFVLKPVLHWMFGLSFIFGPMWVGGGNNTVFIGFAIQMNTYQIFNLCIAQLIFASVFTLLALCRPRGPQPATYGHLQTLANLVDEWSPVMWWGHKEDGIPYCHAGTSGHPLPDVKMDCVYAHSGVVSHPPIPGKIPAVEKPHNQTRHLHAVCCAGSSL